MSGKKPSRLSNTIYIQYDAILFKNIHLDILKISGRIYIKLLTVITLGWRDLDFLIKRECVREREWEDVNEIRASAYLSVPFWRVWKSLLGSPELTNDHPCWPMAPLSWFLSPLPPSTSFPACPSPPPASWHYGTIQLVLGMVPPHPAGMSHDPKGAVGFRCRFSPSHSQKAEVSQA